MKQASFFVVVLATLLLGAASCWAENVETSENFHDLSSSIQFSSYNTVAETDFATYTCSGTNCKFNCTAASSSKICIFMPEQNNEVVISPAISDLKKVEIFYYPDAVNRTGIKVYTSTDNSSWTDVSGSCSYVDNKVTLNLASQGNYYLKIVNSEESKPFYIFAINYVQQPCGCLRIVVE